MVERELVEMCNTVRDHETRIRLLEQNDMVLASSIDEIKEDVKWLREHLSGVIYKTGVQEGTLNMVVKYVIQGGTAGITAGGIILTIGKIIM